MLKDSLFPEQSFTTTELELIAQAFNVPAVQKYFKHLGSNYIKDDTFAQPKEGESAESFLRRRAAVQGQIAMLETLLKIEPTAVRPT